MRQMIKISTLILLSATVAHAATTADTAEYGDYKVRIFSQCQLVSEHNMTEQQIDVYQRLKKHEQAMHKLERPINAIEPQMDKLTEQIEHISELAIQETDDTLRIDIKHLRQQQHIAHQIEQLVALHRADFEALEQQSEKILAVADEFEKQVKTLTEGVEYDHIQIISPQSTTESYHCYTSV